MKRKLMIVVTVALCLTGCAGIPDTYAPPMDRRPVTGVSPNLFGGIVAMNDVRAPEHIVRDVSPVVEGGAWRWTGKRPKLRFVTTKVSDVKLVMDLAIPKLILDAMGPVTLSFFVNDRLLENVSYNSPGNKTYEKTVPAGWLYTDRMNFIEAEIDKVYVSPGDGAVLGFILSRAGFDE